VPVQKIFGSSDSVRTYIGGKKIETNIAIKRSKSEGFIFPNFSSGAEWNEATS
jgi:hypothetical protein